MISSAKLAERNSYCLSRDYTNYTILTLKRLIGRYCNKQERSPVFLKTWHTVETFYGLGKLLSFRQQLNSFAKIEDNSGCVIPKNKHEDFIRTDDLRVESFNKFRNFPRRDGDIPQGWSLEMIWLTRSALRIPAPFDLGCNALSTMRQHSSCCYYEEPSGLERLAISPEFVHRGDWRSSLDMPSLAAASYAHCVSEGYMVRYLGRNVCPRSQSLYNNVVPSPRKN